MPDPPAWAPDAAAVAAILRARTVDDVGAELGEFTENTRPTAATVAELIAQAVGDVEDRVGTSLPDQFHEAARSCAALRAAQLVDLAPERLQLFAVEHRVLPQIVDCHNASPVSSGVLR
jgi:hypothetical protein